MGAAGRQSDIKSCGWGESCVVGCHRSSSSHSSGVSKDSGEREGGGGGTTTTMAGGGRLIFVIRHFFVVGIVASTPIPARQAPPLPWTEKEMEKKKESGALEGINNQHNISAKKLIRKTGECLYRPRPFPSASPLLLNLLNPKYLARHWDSHIFHVEVFFRESIARLLRRISHEFRFY